MLVALVGRPGWTRFEGSWSGGLVGGPVCGLLVQHGGHMVGRIIDIGVPASVMGEGPYSEPSLGVAAVYEASGQIWAIGGAARSAARTRAAGRRLRRPLIL